MTLRDLYDRMPVAVQNGFATAYGTRELVRRHAGSFRRNVRGLEARERWSEERLLEDQAVRLRGMVTWAAHRIPHYRELFAELGIDAQDIRSADDLRALPILEKETVRADPERFLPDGDRPHLVPQTTGGTTGTPLRYWATLDAVRFNYAVYESRVRGWAGVRLGDRMASLHGQPIVPAEQQHGPYWRRNLAFNQLYCSVYHLSDRTLPEYVAALERFAPRVIAGYTSAVHRLATHLLSTGDVGRIRPAAILVSSETLLSSARQDIETAFGCRVWNSYSLGELVAYITECEHGEMHVSTEYGVVELVEVDGRHEIVATGLINRGMPLLRYRTGDLADPVSGGPSSCGRGLPRIENLLGRVDDVVRTPEGAVIGPAPMSLAFQKVPRIRRAQVHQSTIDAIEVLIETAEGFDSSDEDFLLTELRRRLGDGLVIDVRHVEQVPRTSGGKERLVVSTLSRPPV